MPHRPPAPRRPAVARPAVAAVAACLSLVPAARADQGPETVAVVLNADSFASRTAANHYLELRGIHGRAAFAVRDLPDWESVDVETFRTQLLRPFLTAADRRGLSAQLDTVAYGPAVPPRIDLTADFEKLGAAPNRVFTRAGSLTGLTTLYEAVSQGRPQEYLAPNANAYHADAIGAADLPKSAPPTVGFRRAVGYGEDRRPTTGLGRRYLLSAALGVTGGRGEGVEEVVNRLGRTVRADGTDPPGLIAFCSTADVRATTRRPLFDAAVAAVREEADRRGLAVRAEVLSAALPLSEPRVVGLTSGVATADWGATGSRFAPGAAWADNLTSFGAVLSDGPERGGQVTVADWLRAGAAGAGGTVIEPFALPFKFPSPFVHAHRVRGATLGEAVALSVAGPYQYLTVGDPLSAPYADRPVVTLRLPGEAESGTEEEAKAAGDEPPEVRGAVTLAATATDAAGGPVELNRWELSVDGRRVGVFPPGAPLRWDTTTTRDGVAEIAVAAVAAGPLGFRGRAVRTVRVANGGRRVDAALLRSGLNDPGADGAVPEVVWGDPVRLRVTAAGFGDATGPPTATVLHGTEPVASAPLTGAAVATGAAGATGEPGASSGEIVVDSKPLGLGPVSLRTFVAAPAAAPGDGAGEDGAGEKEVKPGAVSAATGPTLKVRVIAPADRPVSVGSAAELADGPAVKWAGGSAELADGLSPDWLAAAGVPPAARFALTAVVTIEEAGLHRLAVRSNCGVRVAAGPEAAPAMTGPTAASSAGASWRSVPLWLEPGRHRLTLLGETPAAGTEPRLEVRWGRRGLSAPAPGDWRHEVDGD